MQTADKRHHKEQASEVNSSKSPSKRYGNIRCKGLNQKVWGQEGLFGCQPLADVASLANRQNLTLLGICLERCKPVALLPQFHGLRVRGKLSVRRSEGAAGMGGWRKRRPCSNSEDRGCGRGKYQNQHDLTRKWADFQLVLYHEKTCQKMKEERK